jgi:signal transduction histidine kinase
VTSRAVLVVRSGTAALVVLVVLAGDWSSAASRDPARILFIGPQGVLGAAGLDLETRFPEWLFVVFLMVGVGYVETGVALWKRRPDSQVGMLLVVAGLLWLAHGLRRSSDPALFTLGLALTNAYNPVLLQVALSVPAGRVRGRRDRTVVIAFYVYSLLANVGGWLVVNHRRLLGGVTPRNLLLIRDAPQVWDDLQPVLLVAAITAGGGILYVFIDRYRRGSLLFRYAFAPMCVAGLAKVTGNLLWEAATVVPPTLAYASFFVGSAAVPVAAFVSVERSKPRPSTMTRVVMGLGQDLPSAHELRDVLRMSTADPTLDVVRFDKATRQFLTLAGLPAELPDDDGPRSTTVLRRNGQDVGALIHDTALADAPEVLRAVQQLAGLVLQNDALLVQVQRQLAEVQESRRRIVEAGDAERARVERNMHDAVQQRLVAATLLLRRADRDLPAARVLELLRQGAGEVETALIELRDIVHGMHPQVLGDGGLAGAIESISERSTVMIRLATDFGEDPLPEVAAMTAYYVTAEAVTNVEKHAQATVVNLRMSASASDLVLTVQDDGVGGAVVTPGGGLAGLRDRVEAYGGTLTVTSPAGHGTNLAVTLPLVGGFPP